MNKAVTKYVDAALIHAAATNAKSANQAYAMLMAALADIQKNGDEGVGDLLQLLEHKSPAVQLWAAVHLLPDRPDVARTTLETLMNGRSRRVAFEAEMVLAEWGAGRLGIGGAAPRGALE